MLRKHRISAPDFWVFRPQVIVGIGKHSVKGMPKLLPAIVSYLADNNIQFCQVKDNPGALSVMLGRPGRANSGSPTNAMLSDQNFPAL